MIAPGMVPFEVRSGKTRCVLLSGRPCLGEHAYLGEGGIVGETRLSIFIPYNIFSLPKLNHYSFFPSILHLGDIQTVMRPSTLFAM
jgi:hypothetical protein